MVEGKSEIEVSTRRSKQLMVLELVNQNAFEDIHWFSVTISFIIIAQSELWNHCSRHWYKVFVALTGRSGFFFPKIYRHVISSFVCFLNIRILFVRTEMSIQIGSFLKIYGPVIFSQTLQIIGVMIVHILQKFT